MNRKEVENVVELTKALREKLAIEFTYDNSENRYGNVHAIYKSKSGKTLADIYQTTGYSSNPEGLPNWKAFDVTKMSNVKVLKHKFEIQHGFKRDSNRYDNSFALIGV